MRKVFVVGGGLILQQAKYRSRLKFTKVFLAQSLHVKNILSIYNLFVSRQLYRESATTNNVYKRDPNEENWRKGNMTDILLRDFVKFCAETRGGRRSDTGLAVPLLMTPKDTHSG